MDRLPLRLPLLHPTRDSQEVSNWGNQSPWLKVFYHKGSSSGLTSALCGRWWWSWWRRPRSRTKCPQCQSRSGRAAPSGRATAASASTKNIGQADSCCTHRDLRGIIRGTQVERVCPKQIRQPLCVSPSPPTIPLVGMCVLRSLWLNLWIPVMGANLVRYSMTVGGPYSIISTNL